MSTMDLEDDLKQLVSDFASIASSYRKAQEESNSLKDSLKEAVVDVLAIQERVEVLERDYEENQNMIQTATEQLSVIPEYRNNIAQLTESHCDLEKIVREKNKEISRLNNKHVENMKLLEEKIERERREDREGHDTRIEEMRDFLKQAHEAEIISLTKHKEREKLGLVEQLESVQKMLLKVELEHEQEIEEMKVKLAAANPSQTGNSSASVKIFKEKLLQMQQHYERQIQDLLSSCDAVQTKGILISNQDSYPSQEPQFKKKKVCFNLNPVVNDEGNNIAITKSDRSDDKSGIQPEVFQSLFQEAKDKFCNSTVTNTVSSLREPCVSSSNTVSTVSESHRSAPKTVSLMGEPLLSFTKTSSTVSESHYSAPKIVSSKGDPNYHSAQ